MRRTMGTAHATDHGAARRTGFVCRVADSEVEACEVHRGRRGGAHVAHEAAGVLRPASSMIAQDAQSVTPRNTQI
jgi:hypothetical protein